MVQQIYSTFILVKHLQCSITLLFVTMRQDKLLSFISLRKKTSTDFLHMYSFICTYKYFWIFRYLQKYVVFYNSLLRSSLFMSGHMSYSCSQNLSSLKKNYVQSFLMWECVSIACTENIWLCTGGRQGGGWNRPESSETDGLHSTAGEEKLQSLGESASLVFLYSSRHHDWTYEWNMFSPNMLDNSPWRQSILWSSCISRAIWRVPVSAQSFWLL